MVMLPRLGCKPIIFGPQPRPDNYREPEDLDNPMEDDTTHGGFPVESPIRPNDAPTPTADAAGRAEDPVLLTSFSEKLDRCMGRIDSLETELGTTKKIMGGCYFDTNDVDLDGLSRMASAALGPDQPPFPSRMWKATEEEEVPLRRKSDCLVAVPGTEKAPMPDLDIPAEFLAEDAQAMKRFEEEQASERLVQRLQAEILLVVVALILLVISYYHMAGSASFPICCGRRFRSSPFADSADSSSPSNVLFESTSGGILDFFIDSDEEERIDVETITESAASPPRSRRKHLGVRSDDFLWDKPVEDFFSSESESDDDMENYIPPLPYGAFKDWEIVRCPLSTTYYHVYYQENRRQKSFIYLKQLLPHVYREDLLLLRRRMNRYFRLNPDVDVGLDLWRDVNLLCQSLHSDDVEDFWRTQDEWIVSSWQLYPKSSVHVLDLTNGKTVYMFVDKVYPIRATLLERMLRHRLTVPPSYCRDVVIAGNIIQTVQDGLRQAYECLASAPMTIFSVVSWINSGPMVSAGSSRSVPADYVPAGHVIISADRYREYADLSYRRN
ncbi:hypothetical protein Tco_0059073 [Tanacetum coccineum]